jgi:predicted transcriptional regulator
MMEMSPAQCRAARGWLGWSQARLANEANVSLSTVRDFEVGRHMPRLLNMHSMMNAFENAGIQFSCIGGKDTGISFNKSE